MGPQSAGDSRPREGVEAGSAAPRPALAPTWLAFAAYGLAFGCLLVRLVAHEPMDDAFITYNYARSIAEGDGFVYSDRYATWGTTTPLFTLMLAALHIVWVPIPFAAKLLDAVAMALQALILLHLAGMMGLIKWRPFVILFWAGLYLYPTTMPGMEYGFFTALSVGAVVLAIDNRWCVAAFVASLATVMRPDGALVALIVGLMHLVHTRLRHRFTAFTLALCLLPLAWYGFSSYYFGRITPQTLETRQFEASGFHSFGMGWLAYFWSLEHRLFYAIAIVWGIVATAVVRPRSLWLLAYVAGYVGLYSAFGIPEFMIYFCPIFFVAIIYGSLALPATLKTLALTPGAVRGTIVGIFAIALVQPILSSIYYYGIIGKQRGPIEQYRAIYEPLARELADPKFAELNLATLEMGVFGYYLRERLIELGGLVSDDAFPYYATDSMADYISLNRPELVVKCEDWFPTHHVLTHGALKSLRTDYVRMGVFVAPNNMRVDLYAREDIIREYGLKSHSYYANHALGRIFARHDVAFAYPEIPPSRMINIGAPLDERFLTVGWRDAEMWGEMSMRWSSKRAGVRFSIGEDAAAKTQGIRLVLYPYAEPGRQTEELVVSLNGEEIGRATVNSGAFNEVLIPCEISAGDNLLSLYHPYPGPPNSRDDRWYHNAVDRIEFLDHWPDEPPARKPE